MDMERDEERVSAQRQEKGVYELAARRNGGVWAQNREDKRGHGIERTRRVRYAYGKATSGPFS